MKIFRNIRQKLASENKVMAYLRYAIGEILLVVIGILIALQVNNWNESRKDNIKEQKILSQLKDDYGTNLLQLEQKITHRKKIIQAANKILQYIDKPVNISIDSLNYQLSILIGTPTFKPIENNLINSGNILLIRNEKLNRLLTNWSSDVTTLQEVEKYWDTKMWGTLVPLLTNMGILRNDLHKWWGDDQNLKWVLGGNVSNPFQIPKSNETLNSSDVLNKKELEGIASIAVSINYAANLQSQVLRKRILEIVELIESEIN